MTIFKTAINDIFESTDFLEECFIEDVMYPCIQSAVRDNVVYGDIGSVEDVDFTLDIKLPLYKMPSRGNKVKFRGMFYKISNVTYDSADASIKLHLQSMSKG